TLGHESGDTLLRTVARRISDSLRPADTLGRFGGDEFVLLCEGVDLDQAIEIAERLVGIVGEPIELAGQTVQASMSVGVASGDEGMADVDALVRNADEAMYEAKRRGGNRVELYDDVLREHHRRRREIEDSLQSAVSRGELTLRYQPVVSARD